MQQYSNDNANDNGHASADARPLTTESPRFVYSFVKRTGTDE